MQRRKIEYSLFSFQGGLSVIWYIVKCLIGHTNDRPKNSYPTTQANEDTYMMHINALNTNRHMVVRVRQIQLGGVPLSIIPQRKYLRTKIFEDFSGKTFLQTGVAYTHRT